MQPKKAIITPIHALAPKTQSTRQLELCILALMIIDADAAKCVSSTLQPHSFMIYEGFAAKLLPLAEKSQLDVLTAHEALNGHVIDPEAWIGRACEEMTAKGATASKIDYYCEKLHTEYMRREALKLAQRAIEELSFPGSCPITVVQELRDNSKLIQDASQENRSATFSGLNQQMEDEISGERVDYGWPWPLMGTSKSMTPGSIITFCGTMGHGKSLFLFEMMWRLFFNGISVSSLNLEMSKDFHLRRVLAQMCGNASILNDTWVRKHPDELRAIMTTYKDSLMQLERDKVFQIPRDNERPTRAMLVNWIKEECERGRKILLIDPSTAMYVDKQARNIEEDILFSETVSLMAKYKCIAIFCTHPKTGPKGIPSKPGLFNISGGQCFVRFATSVFWLESFKNEAREDVMRGGLGIAQEYNRAVHWLKTKTGADTTGRVAFKFDYGRLIYNEVGILPEES